MRCPECGAVIDDDSVFCIECGAEIIVIDKRKDMNNTRRGLPAWAMVSITCLVLLGMVLGVLSWYGAFDMHRNEVVRFNSSAFELAFRDRYGYGKAIYLSDILELTSLDLEGCHLKDISDIALFKNLTELNLNNNSISDAAPITELKKLTRLYISNNNIIDASPFGGMRRLIELDLSGNRIRDISEIKKMSALRVLNLKGNILNNSQISSLREYLRNCEVLY